jgi:hypothetical protein
MAAARPSCKDVGCFGLDPEGEEKSEVPALDLTRLMSPSNPDGHLVIAVRDLACTCYDVSSSSFHDLDRPHRRDGVLRLDLAVDSFDGSSGFDSAHVLPVVSAALAAILLTARPRRLLLFNSRFPSTSMLSPSTLLSSLSPRSLSSVRLLGFFSVSLPRTEVSWLMDEAVNRTAFRDDLHLALFCPFWRGPLGWDVENFFEDASRFSFSTQFPFPYEDVDDCTKNQGVHI